MASLSRDVLYRLTLSRACFSGTARNHAALSSDQQTDTETRLQVGGVEHECDDYCNIRPGVRRLVGRGLLSQSGHPLELLKRRVAEHVEGRYRQQDPSRALFTLYDRLHPVVSVQQNFDSLLVPVDHPSRRRSDNYFLSRGVMLRAHTSAHQAELVGAGARAFLVAGDVYRRDEIDRTHYPVFHQMEGVRLYTREELFGAGCAEDAQLFNTAPAADASEAEHRQAQHTDATVQRLESELKEFVHDLTKHLFGDVKFRWVSCQFPFTHPSWELEVQLDGQWVEVLGCGIMRQQILTNNGVEDSVGWAFGLGLERLAMKLYSIPDIRVFWSQDPAVLRQFEHLKPTDNIVYKPVSIFSPCVRDLSFWLPQSDTVSSTDFCDLVRTLAGDIVEQVSLIDEFTCRKTSRRSQCFRIVYRHMSRSLTGHEINGLHVLIAEAAVQELHVELRGKPHVPASNEVLN